MNPLWFVVIAVALVYLSKIPVAIAMGKAGGYDNRYPRQQQAKLTGWGLRALGVHQNQIESFPVFVACMLTGELLQADTNHLLLAGWTYVALRLVYGALYLANQASLRSIVWALSVAAAVAPAVMGLLHGMA